MESWCVIHAFGADVRCCPGGPRGCCGSCCDASFDKDDLDERMKKKEQAKDAANPEPVTSQPGPSDAMSPIAANSNESKPAKPEDV